MDDGEPLLGVTVTAVSAELRSGALDEVITELFVSVADTSVGPRAIPSRRHRVGAYELMPPATQRAELWT